MASIENRSQYQVAVKHRDDLTQNFPHGAGPRAEAYCQSLTAQGLKARLARLDDCYVVRDRSVSRKNQTFLAASAKEAQEIVDTLKAEHSRSLFINYAQGRQTKFADFLMRYLREESPRHKSFEVEAYKINALLEDAGLERLDLAEIVAAHPNVHPKVAAMKLRKTTGARMGQPSGASRFIRKPFADVVPDDFTDYIDERCQEVSPATVDREIDIFSAVCRMAIDTWRIHVEKSPIDGVRRPRYYNERDRRLKGDEEERLLVAARTEDHERSICLRLEELMSEERLEANSAGTVYPWRVLAGGPSAFQRSSRRAHAVALRIGASNIYEDKASGKTADRPELEHCVKALRDGDTLVVWRLDRLGRNLQDLIRIVRKLDERGVKLKSVKESIDTAGPTGKLVFHMFGALAEFSRWPCGSPRAWPPWWSTTRLGREAAQSRVDDDEEPGHVGRGNRPPVRRVALDAVRLAVTASKRVVPV